MESYSETLSSILVKQSTNELFYSGNIREGAKSITKEVVDTMSVDRTSIWLFDNSRESIILQQLYIKSEDAFYQDIPLHKSDFEAYFLALEDNPIIVANDAETHTATSCFLEGYLKPLGVKSMLDVPIWYKGSLIGVICIESLTPRIWKDEEINFAQILSSLYSFTYSVKETNKLSIDIKEINLELLASEEENRRINEDLKTALQEAEDAKTKALAAKDTALNDLDIIQKKSQTELISTIVKVALLVILSVGVITTIMYGIAMATGKDTQIIGSTWSNMFGILLTNAFSIVGTIMGVKYASENKSN